jgi:hypothetical protein
VIALGVVYPQYWAIDSIAIEEIFFSHLNTLKMTFCNPCKIDGLDQDVPPFLLIHMLHLQCSHFKMTTLHNSKASLCEKN